MASATVGSVAGYVLSYPRVLLAMARDKSFLARIGGVLPVRRTPAFAIVLHALLASCDVGIRNCEQLAATFGRGFTPFSALLIGNALIETPAVASINVLITLCGVPVLLVWRRSHHPAPTIRED